LLLGLKDYSESLNISSRAKTLQDYYLCIIYKLKEYISKTEKGKLLLEIDELNKMSDAK
jgi:hypothetical protein